ncbi:hypothetical protein LCGC14_2834920, partial [marine sediment metagenome]
GHLKSGFALEDLLKVGLIVVALVGASVAIYMYGGGNPVKGSTAEGMTLQCLACDTPFVKQLTMDEMNTSIDTLSLDCPNCGAKKSAIPTVECPKCKAPYVPASYTDPAAKRAGKVKDICPICQTDRDQWYKDYYSKPRE